jgi:glycosyltransferase involved in cell wall biosynthesis
MTVLLLTDSDAFAGTEQHMLALAIALNREGHAVYVGSPSGSPLANRCEASGIETLAVEKKGVVDLGAVASCIRHIRGKSIDVLHVHNARMALVASVVKIFVRSTKIVFTQHFITPTHRSRHGLKRILSDAVHRFIAGGLDQIICVSDATRNAMLNKGSPYSHCHSTVIYNGIDASQYNLVSADAVGVAKVELNIPCDTTVVLIASRLELEKAVHVGLTAFASLVADGKKLILVIAGQGSQLSELKQLASNLGIEESVRFTGFRSDIPVLMAAADIFLFTSPVDSFGMSILEAMAMRTPVVAANAGGPAEIITDGQTGFLFGKGDITDLKQKVMDCLLCPHLDQVTSLARINVENLYSVKKMATETIRVYESLRLRDF